MTIDTALAIPKQDADIEAWIAALPAEAVVLLSWQLDDFARRVRQAQKMAQGRIVAEGILASGQVWTAPDGVGFFWGGDRHREVADPAGLRAALLDLLSEKPSVIATLALGAAFKPQPDKVMLTELDRIVKFGPAEAEGIVRSFTAWKEGGPKLRPVERDDK